MDIWDNLINKKINSKNKKKKYHTNKIYKLIFKRKKKSKKEKEKNREAIVYWGQPIVNSNVNKNN